MLFRITEKQWQGRLLLPQTAHNKRKRKIVPGLYNSCTGPLPLPYKDLGMLNLTPRRFRTIEEAKIVVAIFPDEPGRPYLNPNVIYELGFSDALGKATLIIKPEDKGLPSDLCDFQVVSYKSTDIGEEHFRLKIQNELNTLKSALGESFVHKGVSSATYIYGNSVILCDKELLKQYLILLNYATFIQNRFHLLFTTSIKPLVYSFRRGGDDEQNYDFGVWLNSYKNNYEQTVRASLHKFKTIQAAEIEQALNYAGQCFGKPFGSVHQAYINLTNYLAQFEACAEIELDATLSEITTLDQTTGRVIGYASAFANALVELLEPSDHK